MIEVILLNFSGFGGVMTYKSLKVLSYNRDEVPIEMKYRNRLQGDATVELNCYPILMRHGEGAGSKLPAFFVYTREIQSLVELAMRKSEHIKVIAAQLPTVAHQNYIHKLMLSEIFS